MLAKAGMGHFLRLICWLYWSELTEHTCAGTLPREFARFTGVQYMWLYQNEFTGTTV